MRPGDLQGWRSIHPYLEEAVIDGRPRAIIEIGTWKGASALVLARTMAAHDVAGTVISVDTWLGAVDLGADEALFAERATAHGYPSLHRTFLANGVRAGMTDRIVPFRSIR
ncbi:hypothetical protein JOE48_001356 [Methylobacterium sp. PvR107]|nr:class I SAM-dependent methyltransferase [Methylobacterium sp. PvR107]MBP1179392.1 hypothetical protein [Methylobacterium sp. PvR107]